MLILEQRTVALKSLDGLVYTVTELSVGETGFEPATARPAAGLLGS